MGGAVPDIPRGLVFRERAERLVEDVGLPLTAGGDLLPGQDVDSPVDQSGLEPIASGCRRRLGDRRGLGRATAVLDVAGESLGGFGLLGSQLRYVAGRADAHPFGRLPLGSESFQPFVVSSDFTVKGVPTAGDGIGVAGFFGQLGAVNRERRR